MIDRLNSYIGKVMAWLTLVMALLTFAIVIFRYVFNMSWVWLQDSVLYIHGTIFMLAMGYALLKEAHVRVDVIYTKLSRRHQAFINIFGVIVLLWPTCLIIFYQSWPYVLDSWSVFEGSQDAEGLNGVFLLKSAIPLAMALTCLQGLSLFKKSLNTIRGPIHGQ